MRFRRVEREIGFASAPPEVGFEWAPPERSGWPARPEIPEGVYMTVFCLDCPAGRCSNCPHVLAKRARRRPSPPKPRRTFLTRLFQGRNPMTVIAPPTPTDEVHVTFPVRLEPETRADNGALRLSGYAAVFDSESEDMGFIETLAPGCFRRALAEPDCDPLLLWNHDASGGILARKSAGTLRVHEDAKGLRFSAEFVPTTFARDVHTLAKTGHVNQMSFSFRVPEGGARWSDNRKRRRILEVSELRELSLVPEPAYKATSAEARSLLTAIGEGRVTPPQRRGRVSVRERDAYGPGSEHSYWRDLLYVGESDARQQAAKSDPLLRGRDLGPEHIPAPGTPRIDVDEARRRLSTVERRDLTTAGGSAGGFLPLHTPSDVADAFATAVRTRSVFAELLGVLPLDDEGLTIRVPRFSTGASAAVHNPEGAAVSETDPATALADAPVGTLAGQVDLSRQALDRSNPDFDVALARELGEALAERVDLQIVSGSGASGQLLGLRNVSGITSTTYTDATPTPAELFAALGQGAADSATALGHPLTTLVLHPRRAAWLRAKLGYRPEWPVSQVVESTALPTNLGAGTNEDLAILLATAEVRFYAQPPVLTISTLPGTLAVRVQAFQYAGLVGGRKPLAIGTVGGSGFTPPAW